MRRAREGRRGPCRRAVLSRPGASQPGAAGCEPTSRTRTPPPPPRNGRTPPRPTPRRRRRRRFPGYHSCYSYCPRREPPLVLTHAAGAGAAACGGPAVAPRPRLVLALQRPPLPPCLQLRSRFSRRPPLVEAVRPSPSRCSPPAAGGGWERGRSPRTDRSRSALENAAPSLRETPLPGAASPDRRRCRRYPLLFSRRPGGPHRGGAGAA
mmetsp:Transcript_65400/g.147544  ORF Transcript_65400/g.147544 Transcript_65400/m.147544 type:complete len:209 (-) Transcript_65400:762-1388(-)